MCSVLAVIILKMFSRKRLDKTDVIRDYPVIARVVCVAVTQPNITKLPEDFIMFWKY
jgi:hypothetical protein